MAVGSFSAGLSGLYANSLYLSVIGNNLANINTVGFKASTVSFQDLVSQLMASTSRNPTQVGLGVGVGSVSSVFSQGAIEATRESTNVAIQGSGFFIVRGPEGVAYTRAGNFAFNAQGQLVTPDGYLVQGYTGIDPATGQIITTTAPADMTLPPGVLRAPTVTTTLRTVTNLDASAADGATFTTAAQIYDSLGATHTVNITYTKTGAGAWSYEMTLPGEDVTGGTAGTPFVIHSGTVTFDATGQLATVDGGAAADVSITPPTFTNGAAATPFTWDILDDNNEASLSGYSAPSATSSISQNGGPAGSIEGISIGPDGTITATFGGGRTAEVGRLALATFNNPKGLMKAGSNRYGESAAAGVPNVGVPGAGGRGALIGSALESSNVDIAQEFTQMILAQRGYQANAKTITVSDEVLVETLNIKR